MFAVEHGRCSVLSCFFFAVNSYLAEDTVSIVKTFFSPSVYRKVNARRRVYADQSWPEVINARRSSCKISADSYAQNQICTRFNNTTKGEILRKSVLVCLSFPCRRIDVTKLMIAVRSCLRTRLKCRLWIHGAVCVCLCFLVSLSINQSIGMYRMRWFLAVLRSLFHSSLSYTISCHSSPPTILPSSLTSFHFSHLFLGLLVSLCFLQNLIRHANGSCFVYLSIHFLVVLTR